MVIATEKFIDDVYTLSEAYKYILQHIGGERDITFLLPMQITEGAVCEFRDAKTNSVVATARLRMANNVKIRDGSMSVSLYINNISMSHQSFKLCKI